VTFRKASPNADLKAFSFLFNSVVSFDIAGKPQYAVEDDRIVYMQGDLGEYSDVEKAVEGADCVWHIGALVGPFHPFKAFKRVNYEGTINVIEACKKHKVRDKNMLLF
jgi:nucleoside-diphosphate-sugar epimerase